MIMVAPTVRLVERFRKLSRVIGRIAQVVSESHINYWDSYVTDFTCPLLFAYLGTRHHWNWPSAIFSFFSRLTVFSLIEYAVHRWLLHASGVCSSAFMRATITPLKSVPHSLSYQHRDTDTCLAAPGPCSPSPLRFLLYLRCRKWLLLFWNSSSR
jgi:hypothetical protein